MIIGPWQLCTANYKDNCSSNSRMFLSFLLRYLILKFFQKLTSRIVEQNGKIMALQLLFRIKNYSVLSNDFPIDLG